MGGFESQLFCHFFGLVLLFCFCFFSLLIKTITAEKGRLAGRVFFKEIILGEFTNISRREWVMPGCSPSEDRKASHEDDEQSACCHSFCSQHSLGGRGSSCVRVAEAGYQRWLKGHGASPVYV